MKTWVSVAGTLALAVLTAIISPIAVEKWKAREAATSQLIDVTELTRIPLTSDLIKAGQSNASDRQLKLAHQLYIENNGLDDIYDGEFELVGSEGAQITDIGDLMGLNSAGQPKARIVGGRAKITFELLRKGEVIALWAATTENAPVQARSLTKGLKIEQKHDSATDGMLWVVVLMGLSTLVLGFIVGAWVNQATYNTVLRGIGFDPKEVEQSYIEQRAKAKNMAGLNRDP